MNERDRALERRLTDLAVSAAGLSTDGGLSAFADARAMPGGVRPRTANGWDQEIAEELADARNYCVWAIAAVYDPMLAGDPLAADLYERRMRVLAAVVLAFHELHRDAA